MNHSPAPKWVLDVLPPEWRRKLVTGEAYVKKDPSLGYVLCQDSDEGVRCWKIIRKFRSSIVDLATVLKDGCATVSEVADRLGVSYDVAKSHIHYYLRSGIIYRNGPLFCLDRNHPQMELVMELVKRRQNVL